MRAAGIAGYVKKRKVRTTVPEPSDQKVPDLLKRDFTAQAPGQRYVGDITYLPIADGTNLYRDRLLLTSSRRLGDRRPHAHQPRRRRPQRCRRDPQQHGWAGRCHLPQRPRVYTSKDYAKLCKALGVTQSMGAVGTADNALAESFNATLKREILQDAVCWPDELTCRRQLFKWLTRYNTKRRHSWCRYQSPIAYETSYTATVPTAA